MQYFSEDFNAYVDLEWNDNFDSYKKLRVEKEAVTVLNPSETPPLTRSSSTKTIVVPIDEHLNNPCMYEASTSEQKLVRCNAFSEKDETDPLATISINDNASNYGLLPTSYKLPYINKDSPLGKALKLELPLTASQKSSFIDKIYESFTEKGIFSPGHQYDMIVNAILNEYPYLGSGLPLLSAKNSWKKVLYTKFHNGKRRENSNEAAVTDSKKLKGTKLTSEKFTPLYSIPNYKPVLISDDEELDVVESHCEFMKAEHLKLDRNDGSISKRMSSTFKVRRNMLFEKNIKMAVSEVERLFNKQYPQLFFDRMKKFSKLLVYAVSSSRSKNKAYMDCLFGQSNALIDDSFSCFKATGNVAVLLLEDPKEVIGLDLNTNGAPMLVIEENKSVTLMVDGRPFLSNISSSKAAFLWVSTFSIFNVAVPKAMQRTYNFFQYIKFNIPDTPKFSQNAMRILNIWNESAKI